jgi:hypothetical protein
LFLHCNQGVGFGLCDVGQPLEKFLLFALVEASKVNAFGGDRIPQNLGIVTVIKLVRHCPFGAAGVQFFNCTA